jgi:hypothetical protein
MLATVAEALLRAGQSDEARKAALEALAENSDNWQAGDDRVLSSRADDFANIMVVSAKTGMSRQAQKAGNQALAPAEIVCDDTKKSDAFLTNRGNGICPNPFLSSSPADRRTLHKFRRQTLRLRRHPASIRSSATPSWQNYLRTRLTNRHATCKKALARAGLNRNRSERGR